MTKQRMNNDLISREALKEHKFPAPLIGDYQQGWNDAIDAIIDNAPTVPQTQITVFTENGNKEELEQELQRVLDEIRPKGEWTNLSPFDEKGICDVCCGCYPSYYRFCPNCGADMRKDADNGN